MNQHKISEYFMKKPMSQCTPERLPSKIILSEMDLETRADINNSNLDTRITTPFFNFYSSQPCLYSPIKFESNHFMLSQPFDKDRSDSENQYYLQSPKSTPKKSIKDYFQSSIKEKQIKKEDFVQFSKSHNKVSKKYRIDHQFLVNWLNKNSKNQCSWQSLPKELMRRIMSFLPLEDNARLACVCRFWAKAYKSIWLSYDYFSKLHFKNMNEMQVTKLFENGGRLPHIKHMKEFMKGKKIGPFLNKTKLSTKISNEFRQGKLFETFSLEPTKPNTEILIMDRDVNDICQSSKYSLLYIQLVSCNLLSSRSFRSISQCRNLQELTLHKSMIMDSDAEEVLKNCPHIIKISFGGCVNLTDLVNCYITKFTKKLQKLELASNFKMEMKNIFHFTDLKYLKKINFNNSNLNKDHFMPLLDLRIEELELEGIKELNDAFVYMLANSGLLIFLKCLNIAKNPLVSEEAVWLLVSNSEKIIDLKFEVITERVENRLVENRSKLARQFF